MDDIIIYTDGGCSDQTNIRVNYICEDDDTAVSVHDMRNLGYQYLNALNGGFTECTECGITIKKNKNGRQKYCDRCAKLVNRAKTLERYYSLHCS